MHAAVWYAGPGAQQKAEKRGKEERSEQTSEKGSRSAQQCTLQRGGPQRGRAEEVTGWQSFALHMHFITKLSCINTTSPLRLMCVASVDSISQM